MPPLVVGDVIITDELGRRASRAPDYGVEAEALAALASELAERPEHLLQKLCDTVIDLGIAHSAGVSLLERVGSGQQFRWVALAGQWGRFKGGVMPFDASPCGVVIERDATLLFEQPDRFFPAAKVEPLIHEILLVPFHVDGQPIGTLWINAHGPGRKFDAEDLRLLGRLNRFASAGYRATSLLEAARSGQAELERRVEERTKALRESEERQAFLLRLSDALRPLQTPADIAEAAVRHLSGQLDVSRVCYCEISNGRVTVDRDHARGVPSIIGELPPDMFDREFLAAYRPGEIITVPNVDADLRLGAVARNEFRSRGIAAFADVVMLGEGRRVSVLAVQHAAPRPWTDAEQALIRSVGERVRSAVERAQAEGALRESETRFAQFAASSSDALWIRDAATLAMEYTSPAIETIYGIAPDGILGDMALWVALIVPEDRDTAIAHIGQAREGASVTHEFRIRRPSDGEERWVRNTDFPLYDACRRVQRIGGIAEDVTEAKQSARRLEVLVNELQHRARNLLGVVTAVAGRTLRQGGSVDAFEERLQALSRAQGLLSQHGSDTVAVGALVRAELAAHADGASERATVSGPEVHLTARQVQNFALALHELTTNAVKYGALRDGTGHLAVTWEVVRDRRSHQRLTLSWIESGVAVRPEAVTRRGYGTELIQEALAYALEAEVDYVLAEGGVRCRIEMPIT